MRRQSNVVAACLLTFSAALVGVGCGAEAGPSAVCTSLTSYTATVTTPPSFATDIYPILANIDGPSGGCSQESCHGSVTPIAISPGGTRFLQFLYDPPNIPMAKATLMMTSLNASGMQRVAPGNVATSMLAYKMSGKDGLACIASMCQAGASVGTTGACGDPMPSTGTSTAAERTKILDWIALGALD